MRKKIQLTTLALCLYFGAIAQVSYGPRVGLNLNPEPKNDTYNYRYFTSPNIGFFGKYRINEWLSIKAEVNYNTKVKSYHYQTKESLLKNVSKSIGMAIDPSIIGSIQKYLNDTVYSYYQGRDALGFIEFPIAASINYKQFELSAGGYFGYLTKVSNKQELNQKSALLDIILPAIDSIQFVGPLVTGILTSSYPGYKAPNKTESSNKAPYHKVDYGMITELTYHNSDRLFFSFRYTRGFQNYRISSLRKNDLFNTFTFSIGYSFGAGAIYSKPKGIYDLEKIPVENKN